MALREVHGKIAFSKRGDNVVIPVKRNTNDLLLTGLTHWINPQMDILKIKLTAYDLRLTALGTVFPKIIRIEDDLMTRVLRGVAPSL